jgi:hypothetical protein
VKLETSTITLLTGGVLGVMLLVGSQFAPRSTSTQYGSGGATPAGAASSAAPPPTIAAPTTAPASSAPAPTSVASTEKRKGKHGGGGN